MQNDSLAALAADQPDFRPEELPLRSGAGNHRQRVWPPLQRQTLRLCVPLLALGKHQGVPSAATAHWTA